MNMTKKHKLKKKAEQKLIEYLNECEKNITYSTNTAENEQRRYSKTPMDKR